MVNSNSPADNTVDAHHATGQHPQSAASAPRPTQQSSAIDLPASKKTLQNALRQFMDFPIPGIAFVDILPLFASVSHHSLLIDCLAQQISTSFAAQGGKPDVIVALDARGFLFGPSLALKLGSGFAPVRKRGKLPGPCVEASYEKEYGQDWFQMQEDAIKPGQTALVVDDIIATGGSAQAAGALVEKLGGTLMGYLFILEIEFLKGRDKLNAPVETLLYFEEETKN